ncbi:methyl-accepting chemotaxis protein [Ectopseudomonas guguanensis]|uniref:methyl-accepting chemotaxis protein n=2 Tax=Ectopseudomonas guguanensis TaxID=1198456 RepID=UPI0012D56366|nr:MULTISPECIES: methyl-accepting chemotaxis protein [Pseudomonas]MPT17096.1 methyl-accepting chemotaxis protein [Pseudomonas sp.]WJH58263.1 HAMP domain-containing protein [Pseudomonas guguanensis]
MNTLARVLLDLSVRKKLMAGFGLIMLITLCTVWIGHRALETSLTRFDNLLGVNAIDSKLSQARQQEKNYILRGDNQYLNQAVALADEVGAQAQVSEARLRLPENKALMRQISEDVGRYREKLLLLQQTSDDNQQAQKAMEASARAALERFESLAASLRQSAIEQIRQTNDTASIELLDHANLANTLSTELLEARRREKDFLLRGDDSYVSKLDEHFQSLERNGEKLQGLALDAQAHQTLGEAMRALDQYREQFQSMRASLQARDQSEQAMTERAREVAAASSKSLGLQRTLLERDSEDARHMLFVAAAVAFALGLLCAMLITQVIVGPLQRVVGVARQVAKGDLTLDIRSERGDELGQLMQAMQAMTESLRDLIGRLGAGISQLATAAEELSAVTEQTSAGVTEQRMETAQVATAMNQMAATVLDVARNAESAATSAGDAEDQTRQGGSVVQQAIASIEQLAQTVEASAEAIGRLKGDSANIGTVLDVIKSIAEQTNLLALNAAIEAARAGDAGRGFAVVADEVRALARRTQESTQQIEQLIETLQSGAENAVGVMTRSRSMTGDTVEAARQAGTALTLIDEAVSRIQQMNQQIATASEQQSSVAEEINRSISNIRDIAEQSAAATEQTSVASVDLARLGSDLQQQVNRFRVA